MDCNNISYRSTDLEIGDALLRQDWESDRRRVFEGYGQSLNGLERPQNSSDFSSSDRNFDGEAAGSPVNLPWCHTEPPFWQIQNPAEPFAPAPFPPLRPHDSNNSSATPWLDEERFMEEGLFSSGSRKKVKRSLQDHGETIHPYQRTAEAACAVFDEYCRAFNFCESVDPSSPYNVADIERLRNKFTTILDQTEPGARAGAREKMLEKGAIKRPTALRTVAAKLNNFIQSNNLPFDPCLPSVDQAKEQYQKLRSYSRDEFRSFVVSNPDTHFCYRDSKYDYGRWDPSDSSSNPLKGLVINSTTQHANRQTRAAITDAFVGPLLYNVAGAKTDSPAALWSSPEREDVRISALCEGLHELLKTVAPLTQHAIQAKVNRGIVKRSILVTHFPLNVLGSVIHALDEWREGREEAADGAFGETPYRVYDPCSGWGDRAASALALRTPSGEPKVEYYEGVDPNSGLHEPQHYPRMLSELTAEEQDRHTDVTFVNGQAELHRPDRRFNLVFTSPPYGANNGKTPERYSQDEGQSYIQFPSATEWKEGFLKPMADNGWEALEPGGFFALNMCNSLVNPDICQVFNAHMADKPDAEYVGCLGMRKSLNARLNRGHPTDPMRAAPIPTDGWMAEPIFIWRKRAAMSH